MKGPVGVIASWQGVRQLAPSRMRASAPGGTLSTMSDMTAVAGLDSEVNSDGATLHPPIPRTHGSSTEIALAARGRKPVRRVAVVTSSACARPHPRNRSAGRCSHRVSFLLGPVPHTITPHEKLDSQAVAPAIGENDLALSLHNPRAKQRAHFRPQDIVENHRLRKPSALLLISRAASGGSAAGCRMPCLPGFFGALIHHRIGPRGDCVQLVLNRLSGVPDRDLVCIGGNTDWLANNDREPTQRQIDGRAIPANAAGTQLRRGRTRPRLDRICRTPDASGPEP